MHALERIKSRKISFNLVSRCIDSPDRSIVEGKINKNVMRINSKVLVVAFRKEDDMVIVVTAYVSTKIEKYLNP